MPIEDRFWAKVNVDGYVPAHAPHLGPCSEWTAHLNADGYGTFTDERGRSVNAYLWAYRHFIGPVPGGKELDHLCCNRACVRLDHLEPVTHRENVLRGNGLAAQQARRTHCKYGHPFSGENLRVAKSGKRVCIACERRTNAEKGRKRSALRRAGLWNGSLRVALPAPGE